MENFERLVEKVIESHRIQRGQKSGHPVKDYRSNVSFFWRDSIIFFIQKFLPGSCKCFINLRWSQMFHSFL